MTEEMKQALELEATKEGLAYVDRINRGESPWTDSDMELAYEDGMIAGAKWMRKQMMKCAVDAKAVWYDGYHIIFDDENVHEAMPAGVKDGDKMKLIIIKED